jgi:hypothetical protein
MAGSECWAFTLLVVIGFMASGGRPECIRASRHKRQACRTRFSVLYGTAPYRLKTPARRVGELLSALA